jgi:hypothetical protein
MTNSPDMLTALLDRLDVEISIGHHHAAIGKALENSLDMPHWESAFEFWSFTLKGHFESALLALTRLLDADARAVSSKKLAAAVESRAGTFVKMSSEEVRRQLLPDILNEVQELEKLIEPLKKRRDEMYAHNALQKTLGDREWNIAFADLETAYSRILNLVNRLYVAYKGDEAMIIQGAKAGTIAEEIAAVLNPTLKLGTTR